MKKKGNGVNGSGGIFAAYNADITEKALEVWRDNEKQILCLCRRLALYNTAATQEDYLQEAYLACHLATFKYSRYFKANGKTPIAERTLRINGTPIGISQMKLGTFAYWFIEKYLHRLADAGEVVFDVFGPDGQYVETLTNRQYRRRKAELDRLGYRASSTNIFIDVERTDDDRPRRELADPGERTE